MTQRASVRDLVADRHAHYHFIVKGNPSGLLEDLTLYFEKRQEPERITVDCAHGRIETRKIRSTSALNGYLDFPHLGQAFAIERDTIETKAGKRSHEIAHGITSRPETRADARRLLEVNRGHWSIENSCHYILDWNYDEDRGRIRTGHGPENVTRLRRPSCLRHRRENKFTGQGMRHGPFRRRAHMGPTRAGYAALRALAFAHLLPTVLRTGILVSVLVRRHERSVLAVARQLAQPFSEEQR